MKHEGVSFALLLDKKSKRDPKDRYTEALGEFNEAIEINKNNHDNNGDSINYYAYVGKGIAEFLLRDIETAKLTLGKVPENDLSILFLPSTALSLPLLSSKELPNSIF